MIIAESSKDVNPGINRLLLLRNEQPLVCFSNERQVAIGFAGSDCISQKTIHIYSGDGKLGDGIQLEELLNVGDKQWTEQIRYLAATVVTSLSMSKHSSPSQEKGECKLEQTAISTLCVEIATSAPL